MNAVTAHPIAPVALDALDRRIINRLQDGFPISESPYADVAEELATDELTLLSRIDALLEQGVLSRFGPMYHAEVLGGGLTLAAMCIAPDDYARVIEQVNAFPEVAHNYERDHELNMWFVLATETPDRIAMVIREIERVTGYPVYNMPKKEEFFVGLKFKV